MSRKAMELALEKRSVDQAVRAMNAKPMTKQGKPMIYRCSKCKQLYKRDSDKYWIKSYCLKTDQNARLMRKK